MPLCHYYDAGIHARCFLVGTCRRNYSFTVTAMEGSSSPPNLVGTATVTVNILDANDNDPVFVNSPYSFSVPENQPPQEFVGEVTARDVDSGSNAMVRVWPFCPLQVLVRS